MAKHPALSRLQGLGASGGPAGGLPPGLPPGMPSGKPSKLVVHGQYAKQNSVIIDMRARPKKRSFPRGYPLELLPDSGAEQGCDCTGFFPISLICPSALSKC